jgi:hypothetical protein
VLPHATLPLRGTAVSAASCLVAALAAGRVGIDRSLPPDGALLAELRLLRPRIT